MFDFGPFPGDPDIASAASGPGPLCATTESASFAPAGDNVTAGLWFGAPSECGPYAGPAPAGTATIVDERRHQGVRHGGDLRDR